MIKEIIPIILCDMSVNLYYMISFYKLHIDENFLKKLEIQKRLLFTVIENFLI